MVTLMKDEESLNDSGELEVIGRNSKKLIKLINDAKEYALLDMSDELDKEEQDLSLIIRQVVDTLGMKSLEKGIQIEFNSAKNHKINANKMIESLFENLLSNAIKFSDDGTKINIKIRDESDKKIISVADQGTGVADGNKEAIFDRFTRKDKSGVKGTGLGLAIVKLIIDMHDGKVWIEDNPEGEGSIFFVSLPK